MLNKKTSIRTGILLSVMVLPLLAFAQEFTPLTNLPGLADVKNSNTLPAFLNQLYKLCIGAAAVIAVLQIMRAGTKYFFYTGSVTQNQEAKKLIMNSLLGLLLVLSPAIVFGIINPDILNLKLDFSGLEPEKIRGTIDNDDLTQDERNSCNVYTQLRPQRSDDGSNRCTDGEEQVRNMCCSGLGANEICCARVASTQYLLAYHYNRYERTESGGQGALVCQQQAVRYFADEAACVAAKPTVIPPAQNATFSVPTLVQSCTRAVDRNFTMPALPEGVLLCQ